MSQMLGLQVYTITLGSWQVKNHALHVSALFTTEFLPQIYNSTPVGLGQLEIIPEHCSIKTYFSTLGFETHFVFTCLQNTIEKIFSII